MAITTEHSLFASMGTSEFFEFNLRNPYNVDHSVTVEFDNSDLSVITDAREWRYFKMLNDLNTPVEEQLFNLSEDKPQIFLRPRKSVSVPFRFLKFQTDHPVEAQAPSDPHRPFSQTAAEAHLAHLNQNADQTDSHNIKVYFKTSENKLISILALHIDIRPHIVNQTYRLCHPKHSFLKKSIRLPPLNSLLQIPDADHQTY